MPEPPDSEPVVDLLERSISEAIAIRLKDERLRKSMTLQDVAEASGLSLGMISKIENAQTSPSLRTLARLSHALEVPVDTFLRRPSGGRDAFLVRSGAGIEIVRMGTRHGHRYELLAERFGRRSGLQPCLITLSADSKPYAEFQHSGYEFVHVLEGEMRYRFDENEWILHTGDSLSFDADLPHGPAELLAVPIRFLSVISTTRWSAET